MSVRLPLRRLAASLAGGALGGLVAGLFDAGRAAGGLPSGTMVVASLGLLWPIAVVIAVGAFLMRVALLPQGLTPAAELGARWRTLGAERRLTLALHGALLVLGLALLLPLFGRIALAVLASESSARASGAALALAGVALGALTLVVARGGAALAAPRLAGRITHPELLPAVALLLLLTVAAALVVGGTTSGAGSRFALFGVFKRQELDLWPPALLCVVVVPALVMPAAKGVVAIAGGFALALLPLFTSAHVARAELDRASLLAVERHAPLGKPLLAGYRRLADRDRDGASALWSGGDCAEGDPGRGPTADDIPGNGIDEDCSGADAVAAAPAASAAPRSVDADAFIRARLPEKPNLLLITIDALRAELGYTGYPRKVSPNIDALAAKSAIFERAYALASYTSKSLAPMLIGRYGSETHRGFLHFNRFTKADTFVSERLQQAGIRTVSVQGHWYFFKNYGFERGYDVIDTRATPADQPIEGDRTSNGDELSDRIIAALSAPELANQQFFLWSHYLDPHAEYVQHEQFDFGHRGRERYDGEIAFTDHHLGRVLDALSKLPFADRTVVIITSDHGEAFGEHDFYRHGFELWEVLVRVPLVIHVPGAEPRRIAARRSLIDITPTILDLFGIEPPPSGAKDALRGESLLADVIGPPGHEPGERPIYVDMPSGPYNDERQAYIDEGGLKIVTSMGRVLGLFDLERDPDEDRDLADDRDKVRPLLERSKAFRRSLDEVVERPAK